MQKRNKPDRRIQRTRRALRNALLQLVKEKRYDSILVEEITQRANLGRATFYLHYKDKEDLLVDVFSEMAKEIPLHYQLQMQHQMIVSGRESVVFCLYFEGCLRLFRYESCPDMQSQILDSSRQFLEDLQQAQEANERQNNAPQKK